MKDNSGLTAILVTIGAVFMAAVVINSYFASQVDEDLVVEYLEQQACVGSELRGIDFKSIRPFKPFPYKYRGVNMLRKESTGIVWLRLDGKYKHRELNDQGVVSAEEIEKLRVQRKLGTRYKPDL